MPYADLTEKRACRALVTPVRDDLADLGVVLTRARGWRPADPPWTPRVEDDGTIGLMPSTPRPGST
jgi:hypothetical protein